MCLIDLKTLYEGLKPFAEEHLEYFVEGSYTVTNAYGTCFTLACRDKNGHKFTISIPIKKEN